MHYRVGTNDFNTLTASLDEDEYGLPAGLTGVAIDIGGYLGSVGIALALDSPGLRVIIIEPVPDNLELIRRNLDENRLTDDVSLIAGAVGMGGEDIVVGYRYQGSDSLDHHAFVGNSSIAGPDTPHESITYRAIGLSDLIGERGRIAFLKIDCEGGEWSFFHDPEQNAKVDTIVGEAHAVWGHKGGDIVELLAETHDVTLSGDPEGTCGFTAVRR